MNLKNLFDKIKFLGERKFKTISRYKKHYKMNRYEIKFDISDYKPEEIIRSYNLFQLHPKRKINLKFGASPT